MLASSQTLSSLRWDSEALPIRFTAEELVQVTTGCTFQEAATAVRVGIPTTGTLSAAGADTIRVGLGSPSDSVPTAAPATVAECPRVEALTLDVDRLSMLARQLQDEIDETGIADREKGRHTKRSLRVVKQTDGVTRLVRMMDPGTAARVTNLFDRATSPRCGGPRFTTSSTTATGTANATAPTTGLSPTRHRPGNESQSACTREAEHTPNPTRREPEKQGNGKRQLQRATTDQAAARLRTRRCRGALS